MNYERIVSIMKTNNFIKICENESNILKKSILCRHYLSSNKWSVLLENEIRDRFCLHKARDNISGDAKSLKNFNIEIKVSLGSSNKGFNFVQLRPHHNVDYYLFLVYDLYFENLGKNYWFLIDSKNINKLILEYGSYAHGNTSNFGRITPRNISTKTHEYSLRPNPYAAKNTKANILWEKMLIYSKTEEEICYILN